MEQLLDNLYESYILQPNLHKGFALFTMGLPASGKTTHSKKALIELGINPSNIIHLDPDDILEELRKYMKTSDLSTLNKQSIILSSKLYNKIITSDEQYSIIYYGTGKSWSSYQTMINKAKKKGYTTGLINVKLDLETAISRNTKRGINGGRSVGREIISNIDSRLYTPNMNSKTPKKYLGKTNYQILSSLVNFVYNIDTSENSPTVLKAKGKLLSKKSRVNKKLKSKSKKIIK